MTFSKSMKARLEQFRALEREATDPFAARLVHEIVNELEARLQNPERPNGHAKDGAGTNE